MNSTVLRFDNWIDCVKFLINVYAKELNNDVSIKLDNERAVIEIRNPKLSTILNYLYSNISWKDKCIFCALDNENVIEEVSKVFNIGENLKEKIYKLRALIY